MRLLLSGSKLNDHTIAAFFAAHLGRDIRWQFLTFHDEYSMAIKRPWNRVIFKLFPEALVRRMNRSFVRQVKAYHPDIVLLFKGMEISKNALKQLKLLNIPLVNYNFDHPFLFFSPGTGNKRVEEAIPYYDLHITYSTLIAAELKAKYNVRTAILPFGFALTPAEFEKVRSEDLPEIVKACFVGNPDHLRVTWLKEFMSSGIQVDVFGFGWERYFSANEMLTIHPPTKAYSYWGNPLDFWRTLRRYRVQLNFLRPHNQGSHNLRSFEIPGVGGILLTPDTPEQRSFFTVDEEIFVYHDMPSCIQQCRKLLSLTRDAANQIRERARARSVASGYSYADRTAQLIKILREQLN